MIDLIYIVVGIAVLGVFGALRRRPEEDLTMIVELIYGAAALAIAVYMVAALLRPDKF